MISLRFPLVLLMACASCDACTPKVGVTPPASTDDSSGTADTSTVDSADTSAPVDTSPPPPCAQPEVEPNDSLDDSMFIELEGTVCGSFDSDAAADLDYFSFKVPSDTTWIKVDVNAISRGSYADPTLYLNSEDDDFMLIERDINTNDPLVIFPVPEGTDDWDILLVEVNSGSGPDYTYDFMVSATKPPVDWTDTEIEPNDDFEEAMVLTEDMVVFGDMNSQSDLDQYSFQPPLGDNVITVHVTALTVGSALSSRLVYSEPVYEVLDSGDPGPAQIVDYDKVGTATGSAASSPDAIMEIRADGTEPLFLTVRSASGAHGPAHWYTLSIESIEPYVAPADTADTGGAGR